MSSHTECPFCRSQLPRAAIACAACGASKVAEPSARELLWIRFLKFGAAAAAAATLATMYRSNPLVAVVLSLLWAALAYGFHWLRRHRLALGGRWLRRI